MHLNGCKKTDIHILSRSNTDSNMFTLEFNVLSTLTSFFFSGISSFFLAVLVKISRCKNVIIYFDTPASILRYLDVDLKSGLLY